MTLSNTNQTKCTSENHDQEQMDTKEKLNNFQIKKQIKWHRYRHYW